MMKLISKIILRQKIQWRLIRAYNKLISPYKSASHNIVIIPCDLEYIGGSRGDEAMIMGTIDYYKDKNADSIIYIACFNDNGKTYVNNLGIKNVRPLDLSGCAYNIYKSYKRIVSITPSGVAILGADCMDGYYSDYTSIYLLALHDILSSISGCKSNLLGFSFNEKANPIVVKAFRRLSDNTEISIRDNVSLKRFVSKTNKKANLTTDVAFLLKPTVNFEGYVQLQNWINKKKKEDIRFIGFNFHPMLKSYSSEMEMKDDAIIVAKNLEYILKENLDIYIVLIPHDNRYRISDTLMLDYIYEFLKRNGVSNRVYYDTNVYHANQIKGLVGLLDGMVTSRMHLAIACLGQGVPVMSASYQGKFEGLFEHFGLSKYYILDSSKFLSNDFNRVFSIFYNELDSLKVRINNAIGMVLEMSRKNFKQ